MNSLNIVYPEVEYREGTFEEYNSVSPHSEDTIYWVKDKRRLYKGDKLYTPYDEGTSDPTSPDGTGLLYFNSAKGTLHAFSNGKWVVVNDTYFKGLLDKKVDKSSSTNIVYSTGSSGAQSTTKYTSDPTQYTIAYRSANGVTSVGTPTADTHATTKKYVDTLTSVNEGLINQEITDRKQAVETVTQNLNAEISRAKSEEDSIRAIASSAFHFKGTKPSYDDLPKTGNTQGDVWQVGDKEYAWNGTAWVELGFNIDLSPYITTVDAETKIATAKSEAISTANTHTDTQVAKKQNTLVSGSNIKALKDDTTSAQTLLGSGNISFKTINGNSLFGTGNIEIQGGGSSITVDDTLSLTSTNPVQNKVITNALNNKQDIIGTVDVSNNTFISSFPNFTDINFLSSVHGGDLSLLSDSKSVRLVAPAGDIITETSKYTMSYDNTKEAIVINFT